MHIIDEKFLKRLSISHQDYQEKEEYLNIANYFANLSYAKESTKEQSLEESIRIIKEILNRINKKYLELFNQMLIEEKEDNPIIYIYKSNNDVKENESLTYFHEIHFYKTDTIYDISLLLHEFSHFLINRNNAFDKDKSNNEIVPILIEFIISDLINNSNYLIVRLNSIIYEAKSILLKHEILNGNFNLDELYQKYNLTKKDITKFETDLLYSKNLKYDTEISYLKGYIYAYYYSLSNSITNYTNLVERLNISRNIELPNINIEKIHSLQKK